MEEARLLNEEGVKEIVLTGVNIGTYLDQGKTCWISSIPFIVWKVLKESESVPSNPQRCLKEFWKE